MYLTAGEKLASLRSSSQVGLRPLGDCNPGIMADVVEVSLNEIHPTQVFYRRHQFVFSPEICITYMTE